MEYHAFNTEIAKAVGVNAAVIAYNIQYWCQTNEANESKQHFHEGRYWMFNSHSAWIKIFPYFSRRQVRTGIEKLVEAGIVIDGCFNKDIRDRTKWYSFVGFEGMSEMTDGGVTDDIDPMSEMTDGGVTSDTPLPIIGSNYNKTHITAARDVFDFYNQLVENKKLDWPKSRVLSDKLKAGLNARIKEYSLDDVKGFMERVAEQPWANGGFDQRNTWRPTLHYFTQPSAYAKHFDKLMSKETQEDHQERNKAQLLENLFVQFAGSNQWNGARYGFDKHPYDTYADYPKELYEKNKLVLPSSMM